MHSFKRLKYVVLTKINQFIYEKLYSWYKAFPKGRTIGRRLFYPKIKQFAEDFRKENSANCLIFG